VTASNNKNIKNSGVIHVWYILVGWGMDYRLVALNCEFVSRGTLTI